MEFLEFLEYVLSFIPAEYTPALSAFYDGLPWLVLAVTLLTCFFGHKIHKLWVAFFFFCIGFFAGALTGLFFPESLSMSPFIMLGLILGVLAAYYSSRLRYLQLFLINAFFVFSALPGLLSRFLPSTPALLISLAAALAAGVLAARYKHVVTTVTTAVSSGLNAGTQLFHLLSLPSSGLTLLLGGLLAAAGLTVQFLPAWLKWRSKRAEHKEEGVR